MKTLTTKFSSLALLDDTAAKWQEKRVKSSLGAVRRRAWLIVFFACLGLAGAAMWLSVAKPQYNATAMVQLDSGNKFSNFDNVVTSAREGDPDVSRTEVEVLRSDAVVERVVRALDLTNDPEFSPAPATWRTRLVDSVFAELKAFSNSLLQRDSGVPSGSRDADAGKANQFVGFGQPPPNGMRRTVLPNNPGVIRGSIANDAHSSGSQLPDDLGHEKVAVTIQ